MHGLQLYTICLFYILLSLTPILSFAAPTTAFHSKPTDISSTSSISSASIPQTSLATALSSAISAKSSATTPKSIGTNAPRPHPHTNTFHPWVPSTSQRPIPTPPTPPSSDTHPQHHHRQPLSIVGIVLGSLIGFGLVVTVVRCWWSWKKTPSRDRIATLVNRYNLEREMEEAAIAPHIARVWVPPPPPYRAPPPGYESVMPSSPPPAHTELSMPSRDEYI